MAEWRSCAIDARACMTIALSPCSESQSVGGGSGVSNIAICVGNLPLRQQWALACVAVMLHTFTGQAHDASVAQWWHNRTAPQRRFSVGVVYELSQ